MGKRRYRDPISGLLIHRDNTLVPTSPQRRPKPINRNPFGNPHGLPTKPLKPLNEKQKKAAGILFAITLTVICVAVFVEWASTHVWQTVLGGAAILCLLILTFTKIPKLRTITFWKNLATNNKSDRR